MVIMMMNLTIYYICDALCDPFGEFDYNDDSTTKLYTLLHKRLHMESMARCTVFRSNQNDIKGTHIRQQTMNGK